MNKIKDIIYNKSDILIAILILAIAALIIFWRLGIILEYPKEIIGTDSESEVFTEPTETDDQTGTDTGDSGEATTDDQTGTDAQSGEGTDAQAGEDAQSGDAQTGEGTDASSGEGEQAVDTSKAQWEDGKLAADLDVLIEGTTATATVQCLIDAGVFEDYAEYQNLCTKMGYDHNKMRAGDFRFDKGSTKEDIIKQINYSKA